MDQLEVFQKIINKASEKGWDIMGADAHYFIESMINHEPLIVLEYHQQNIKITKGVKEIVYDHDFAESFWNNNTMHFVVFIDCAMGQDNSIVGWRDETFMQNHDNNLPYYETITEWEYHLQTMVLEQSPIKYLKDFL